MSDEPPETVLIDRIGHRGDGIGESRSGPVYVPFVLPGEEASIERVGPGESRARLMAVASASPERVQPVCRHFGTEASAPCGGCSLQMMSLEANRELKRRFVADALAGQGIDCTVGPAIGAGLGDRRRAVLSARKTAAGVVLGYHQRGSAQIVDIDECPVLVPQISDCLSALRTILEELALNGGPARLIVLSTDSGLDVDIAPDARKTSFGSLADAGRHGRLVSLCRQSRIARLTLNGELAVKLADPALTMAGTRVIPPPAAFTQPTAATEAAMSELVTAHLADCGKVMDLFSGIGTFTLALARQSRVHAVEIDQTALSVLDHSVRQSGGLKQVTTERRDILRYPVSASEMAGFSGAVFDPPRAGARSQAEEIAASEIAHVAAVSCNPATFARDCRILLDGGFRLLEAVPVDQFVYSAETEIVGLLSR